MTRPPERTSRVANCLAITAGLRWGRMMMPVASRMVLVWAAAQVSARVESSAGSRGSMGDGGRCGSGSTMCSPAHRESKPADSAWRAVATRASGRAGAPMLMWTSPRRGLARAPSGASVMPAPAGKLCGWRRLPSLGRRPPLPPPQALDRPGAGALAVEIDASGHAVLSRGRGFAVVLVEDGLHDDEEFVREHDPGQHDATTLLGSGDLEVPTGGPFDLHVATVDDGAADVHGRAVGGVVQHLGVRPRVAGRPHARNHARYHLDIVE